MSQSFSSIRTGISDCTMYREIISIDLQQDTIYLLLGTDTAMEDEWQISAESIANYHAVAQQITVAYDMPLYHSGTGLDALETVIDTACTQGLSEDMLENLNRVARMVML